MKLTKFKPDNPFNLNIERKSLRGPCEEHSHDCTELTIVLKGTATQVINGRASVAKAGDVYVIKPGVSHGFEDLNGLLHCTFSYMPELLDEVGPDVKGTPGYQKLFAIGHAPARSDFDALLRLSMESLSEIETLVESMREEMAKRKPGWESVVKARFVEFVALLSRECMEAGAKSGTPVDIERAAKLASRLERRFKEPPRIPETAKELGVSERQLRRVFQRHYGVSPLEYLMKVRLERAAELLKKSGKTLSEIAFECGFSDSNYLSRQFKARTGAAPSLWRPKRAKPQG